MQSVRYPLFTFLSMKENMLHQLSTLRRQLDAVGVVHHQDTPAAKYIFGSLSSFIFLKKCNASVIQSYQPIVNQLLLLFSHNLGNVWSAKFGNIPISDDNT